MLDDLTERIQASQNKFEALVAQIPGYAGYKQKEQRREADRLLRLHVAREYQTQLKRLNGIQYTLTTTGRLSEVATLERGSMRLQRLIDRLKTASYGYTGLFDAIKVDEQVLDRLYEFDQGMLGGAETLAGLLSKLSEVVDGEGDVAAAMKDLLQEIDRLNDTFDQRQDTLTAQDSL